jgi:cyclopropane fatty-acyl-phospholipid synthase-like methyltransferase
MLNCIRVKEMDKQLHTVNIYNQYVKEYIDKFMNFDLYNDTFDYFLKLLPRESNVLELGCGPGNVVKYFSTRRQDLNILGVDLSPEMLKQAEKINPDSEFKLLDIRKADQINKKYNAVVGAFCLPYLSFEDLNHFFNNLKNLTEDEGLIYLSCMEGTKERSGFEKTSFTGDSEIYIYYHQRDNLESRLKENGFNIEKFYTKDYPETDGTVTTDIIYIARKKIV